MLGHIGCAVLWQLLAVPVAELLAVRSHAAGCCMRGVSAWQTAGLKFACFVTWHG